MNTSIEALFQAQRDAYVASGPIPLPRRKQLLQALKLGVQKNRKLLQQAIHQDFRKHPDEVDLTEIDPLLAEINAALGKFESWSKPVRVGGPMTLFGTTSELRYEAKGVVAILAPWNYPINLTLTPIVAALAAGNRVIVRPSAEKVPNTARAMEKLIQESFDSKEVHLVYGGIESAEQILKLPFDHFFFTGSPRVGRIVMEAAAKHLATVTLELGGKSPVIIEESADIDMAAEHIAWGKFVNAGQTCVAADYILVQQSVHDAFVNALKKKIAQFYGATDAARAQSPDFARLVDPIAFKRVRGLLDESVRLGAQIAIGGNVQEQERYIAPTVVTNVGFDSPLMSEEIFGPVLPILPFTKIDEAIRKIRSRPKPLALYLFTRKNPLIEYVLMNTSAGGTCVNTVFVHLANHELPFGGVGNSGQGSYHGHFGFKTFSHERAVLKASPWNLLKFFFPPYASQSRTMRRVKELIS